MAENNTTVPEESMFDPTLKKKKKKKKGALDLDEALGETPASTEQTEATDAVESVKSEQKQEENLSDDQLDDDFAKKKKKKKKKLTFDVSDLGESLPAEDAEEEPSADAELDKEFDTSVKKKRKSTESSKAQEVMAPEAGASSSATTAWAGSDRDYTYDELLTRVFDIMREKNPDIVGGDRKKLVLRPPQVVRIGTRKTSFVNFHDIAKLLHRQPKHLLAYLLSELGTVGNIDGNNQLIIKGRFQPKHIENVLRRYIKEYVSCHTCKSPDTQLQKDTRLFFLQCQTCNSRCSVANIKSGFQAVTGRRAAIRARTT